MFATTLVLKYVVTRTISFPFFHSVNLNVVFQNDVADKSYDITDHFSSILQWHKRIAQKAFSSRLTGADIIYIYLVVL